MQTHNDSRRTAPHRSSMGIAPPRYSLPAFTKLGPIRLQVADLDRSLSFYEGLLGFEQIERTESGVVLGVGGETIVELKEHPGARAVPRRGLLGLFHNAFLLPDRTALARFVCHLLDRGIRPGMSDHLVSEAVYLSDPDGLGVEVYADRPREKWRIENGQIAMATDPLDLRDLLDQAGEEPWDAMPEGTHVGHVHLHVGDLERAARFYHEALGFDKIVWSYPGALFLSAGGYHHHLGLNTWAGNAPPAGDDDAGLLEWTLEVPDYGVLIEQLRRGGDDVSPGEDGSVIADPWGTRVRLLAST